MKTATLNSHTFLKDAGSKLHNQVNANMSYEVKFRIHFFQPHLSENYVDFAA